MTKTAQNHTLTDKNSVTMRATCAVCGPDSRYRYSNKAQTKTRCDSDSAREYLADRKYPNHVRGRVCGFTGLDSAGHAACGNTVPNGRAIAVHHKHGDSAINNAGDHIDFCLICHTAIIELYCDRLLAGELPDAVAREMVARGYITATYQMTARKA